MSIGTKIGFLSEYRYLCEDVKQSEMRNIVKKTVRLTVAIVVFCLVGCGKVQDIKVTSVELENIGLKGLRDIEVRLAVGVDNPAMQVNLSEIEATLKRSGKIIGKVFVDPFILQARSAEIYHLKADVKLDTGVSLRDVMTILNDTDLKVYTVDLHLKAALKNGISTPLDFKDIPLKELMESTVNEKV